MTMDEKPANQLAKIIVDRLINESLLRKEKCDQLIAKIASGAMSEEDWGVEIELLSEEASQK